MDGGGVCRVESESPRKRGDVQRLRMGRHADKRHVLRRGSPESHDLRRRPVSHRLHREMQEGHGSRSLEGLARQIRQLDKQEGPRSSLKVIPS